MKELHRLDDLIVRSIICELIASGHSASDIDVAVYGPYEDYLEPLTVGSETYQAVSMDRIKASGQVFRLLREWPTETCGHCHGTGRRLSTSAPHDTQESK